ncbi:hypothetical protein ACJZ2D_014990 [Fusarium nematophilum]
MAELAGLALAIPPTIELCIKSGRELKILCSALIHADAELSERILRLNNSWLRFMHQLSFVSRVEHVMGDEHRDVHEQTLCMLLSKLEVVTLLLKRLAKQQTDTADEKQARLGGKRKVKYAFNKDSLDKAIDELEVWQRIADQSWFLIMKIADPRIDEALPARDNTVGDGTSVESAIPEARAVRAAGHGDANTGPLAGSGITIKAEELDRMNVWPVPFSVASLAQRVFSPGTVATYVLSRIQCQPLAKYDMIKRDARDLARKLQHNDPHTFGLLSCKGLAVPSAIPQVAPGGTEPEVALTMVFRTPPGCGCPRSLRDLLLNTPRPSSLSFRFGMARELAKAVSYIHTFGFVHKTIRPESILTFTTGSGKSRSVFLVGFENFRRENGWTQRRGDDTLDRNLYRHPSRQGACPREDYVMQHDIYSLGVCLLEIGLWGSFIAYNPRGGQDAECLPTNLLLGSVPGAMDQGDIGPYLLTRGQERLLFLARSCLPEVMGTKYAEIVETCLTCLDEGNGDFGDARDFEDEDGIRVGVRYIEKILLRLNTLIV